MKILKKWNQTIAVLYTNAYEYCFNMERINIEILLFTDPQKFVLVGIHQYSFSHLAKP